MLSSILQFMSHEINSELKRCTKCIMPETKPGISFNEKGICNACQNAELKKKIDWQARFNELLDLADEAKKQKPTGYNCLVPVSGGKDSTFLAVTAKEKLGLRPLLVFVEPAYITERGRKNLRNLSKLGFDIFVFKPNQKILPPLLKRSFYEDGQPARAFEFMLCSVPMQVAINYKIPLVTLGENALFEYGNKGDDHDAFAAQRRDINVMNNQGADHWVSPGITFDKLLSYKHPNAEEFKEAGVKSIYMSYFVNWDSQQTAEFAIKRGLSVRPPCELKGTGGYWDFEQLDDEIPVISHLLKYLKFGFGRATDQACRDLRAGHINREQALYLAKKYDGHCDLDYIRRFCDYIGITIEEFWKVADSFRDPKVWQKQGDQWKLKLKYE